MNFTSDHKEGIESCLWDILLMTLCKSSRGYTLSMASAKQDWTCSLWDSLDIKYLDPCHYLISNELLFFEKMSSVSVHKAVRGNDCMLLIHT